MRYCQFIILKCFGQPWACSTTRNWNAWINLLYIQLNSKTFIPQLILEILLTHHLKELWTCPDMPHHTQSKCLDQFVASVDTQPHTHTRTRTRTHTHTNQIHDSSLSCVKSVPIVIDVWPFFSTFYPLNSAILVHLTWNFQIRCS